MAVILFCGVLGFIVWYFVIWFVKFQGIKEKTKTLVGPEPVFLVGNALDFPTTKHIIPTLTKYHSTYGGIVKFRIGLSPPTISIANYDFLEFLLNSTKLITKSKEYYFLERWLGTGLLTSTGEKWQKRRKLVTPSFHFQILEQFIDVFNTAGNVLVKQLKPETKNESTDIYPYVTLCALDAICESAMGIKIHAQENQDSAYVKSVKEMGRIVVSRAISPLKRTDFFYFLSRDYQKERSALKVLHGTTDSVIRQRRDELLRRRVKQFKNCCKKSCCEFLDDKFYEIVKESYKGKCIFEKSTEANLLNVRSSPHERKEICVNRKSCEEKCCDGKSCEGISCGGKTCRENVRNETSCEGKLCKIKSCEAESFEGKSCKIKPHEGKSCEINSCERKSSERKSDTRKHYEGKSYEIRSSEREFGGMKSYEDTLCQNTHCIAKSDLRKSSKECFSSAKPMLENGEKLEFASKKRLAFLDLLIGANLDGKPLLDGDIREEVDTFMFEGHDTTSCGLGFTLYCLAKNPDVQEKVYEELLGIFGSDDSSINPSYNDLQEMKYLEMVIKESMRLYPPVPIFNRVVMEDTEYRGNCLPKGTTLLIFAIGMHRSPDFFQNPMKFDPERFLPENRTNRRSYSYIPFSAGARNCVGQKFAMLELKATISKVIRTFKLLPVPEFEPVLSVELILKSTNGIRIKLQPR